MNLIDVNLLKDHLSSVFRTSKQVGISADEDLIMKTISHQPIVDAVCVVRCKDCENFYVTDYYDKPMCKRTATKTNVGYYGLIATQPYGFCSYGVPVKEPVAYTVPCKEICDLGFEYEHFFGDVRYQKNQICEYSFDDEEKNASKAIVRIEEILDDPRDVARVSFLEVINDDTGNGLFDYLLKSRQTMNASLKYLKPLKKIN